MLDRFLGGNYAVQCWHPKHPVVANLSTAPLDLTHLSARLLVKVLVLFSVLHHLRSLVSLQPDRSAAALFLDWLGILYRWFRFFVHNRLRGVHCCFYLIFSWSCLEQSLIYTRLLPSDHTLSQHLLLSFTVIVNITSL